MSRTRRNVVVDGDLLPQKRVAEIEAAYAIAYALHPLSEPDEWGDLASFRAAVR